MAQNSVESSSPSLTFRDLTIVVIRLYALYLLLSSLLWAIGMMAFFLSMEWKNIPGSSPYMSSVSFALSAGAAILLLVKSGALADFILSGQDNSRVEWTIDAPALVSAALTVLGISFLVSGLQGISGQGVRWLLAPKDELTGMRAHLDWDVTLATSSIVQFLAGVVLIVGFTRFGRWLSAARNFFSLKDDSLTEPEKNPEDPSDKDAAQKPDL